VTLRNRDGNNDGAVPRLETPCVIADVENIAPRVVQPTRKPSVVTPTTDAPIRSSVVSKDGKFVYT